MRAAPTLTASRTVFFRAIDELATVGDLVRFGASALSEAGCWFGHGSDNALDEAHLLVLHAVHLRDVFLVEASLPQEFYAARVASTEKQAVGELLWRRVNEKIPAAYLIGEALFAGLPFYVDERVLVPRSPLAEVIDLAFGSLLSAVPDRILDIGTGSGCIAIACAYAAPEAEVVATDVDEGARKAAWRNVQRHGLEDRVHVVGADVFDGVDGRFDLVISNPPYVPRAVVDALPSEYRHEPRIGLDAGIDGLNVVRRLLAAGNEHLTPEGMMIVEVGEACGTLEATFPDAPFIWLDDELESGGEGVFMIRAADLPLQ